MVDVTRARAERLAALREELAEAEQTAARLTTARDQLKGASARRALDEALHELNVLREELTDELRVLEAGD